MTAVLGCPGHLGGTEPCACCTPDLCDYCGVGTIAWLVILVAALVLSAQLLMLTDRGKPWTKRLTDLGAGGDAYALAGAGMLTAGGVGAVVGSLLGYAGAGGAAGVVLALLAWTVVVVRALQPRAGNRPPARHREP